MEFSSIIQEQGANLVIGSTFVPPPAKPEFYAHVNIRTNTIEAISPAQQPATDESMSIKLDFALAEKFLLGTENIMAWIPYLKGEEWGLMRKADTHQEKIERLLSLSIYELTDPLTPRPDITVEVGARPDAVLIHYDGDKISSWPRAAKLYITAEGNPHYLKQAFSLDVNIVTEIMKRNRLKAWPNPIVLKLPAAEDISVYTIKSQLRLAIIRHENTDS